MDVPFNTSSDSSYQNTCEFMAILLGLLLAHFMKLHNFRYQLIGDSTSSLSWAKAGRSPSHLAKRSLVIFSL